MINLPSTEAPKSSYYTSTRERERESAQTPRRKTRRVKEAVKKGAECTVRAEVSASCRSRSINHSCITSVPGGQYILDFIRRTMLPRFICEFRKRERERASLSLSIPPRLKWIKRMIEDDGWRSSSLLRSFTRIYIYTYMYVGLCTSTQVSPSLSSCICSSI